MEKKAGEGGGGGGGGERGGLEGWGIKDRGERKSVVRKE